MKVFQIAAALLIAIQQFPDVLAQDSPEVMVDINLDLLHEVGGVHSLDRKKFITIHASHTDMDLSDEPEMFRYMMDKLDISFGRNMGRINWDLNQVAEDQTRPGYPNYAHMVSKGNQSRAWYAGLTGIHHLEEKSSLVVCPPVHPFWPAYSPTNPDPCCGGTSYTLASVSATAELIGNWLNLYHGRDGMPPPTYLEVINEPLWQMVDNNQIATIPEVFDYHKELANRIRTINDKIKIGGYTTAIPAFENENFTRWNDRWKLFIDSVGSSMDFFSLHFYDVYNNNGQKQFRKGSNLEATFDIIEHYSHLALDTIKPFVISEFGAQTNHMKDTYWTPYRDWLLMKSISPMWLSFMARPNLIAKAVPFVVAKATWFNSEYPYHHRLMRKASEMEGVEGTQWVFTEFIKVYQLWAEVRGTRIDTYSTDPDIQVDSYVDGNEAYVVLNNLEFDSKIIGLNLNGQDSRQIRSVTLKHLFFNGTIPSLDTVVYSDAPPRVEIGAEATMVLKYSFGEGDTLDTPETSTEVKYYADSYLKPILAGTSNIFKINHVSTGTYGEALLRVGLGRDHGQTLQPQIRFNDSMLVVPDDFRGDAQSSRNRFFGVIEVPVPYHLLKDQNSVTIEFSDSGGHISSVALQVFNFTRDVQRSHRPAKFDAVFKVVDKINKMPVTRAMVIFGSDTAYTNDLGVVVMDTVREGTYPLQISAQDYTNYSNPAFQHFKNTRLDIKLVPNRYQLTFHLEEEELKLPVYNARIDAEGHIGYSNPEGDIRYDLFHGLRHYHITDDYFLPLSDSVMLVSDTLLGVNIKRVRADAKFVVWGDSGSYRVPDAVVELGDTVIISNSLGLATFIALKVDTLYTYRISSGGIGMNEGILFLTHDSTIHVHLGTLGAESPERNKEIELWPNPVTHALHIKLILLSSGLIEINLVDLRGRNVKKYQEKGSTGENQFDLDVSEPGAGVYFLQIHYNDRYLIHKIYKH